ncbi:hypothetical protein [Aeromonas salmonicida]|uniref:hypothetical protein n=1 Tax=Aeromonas salmonicida TaxID=645 RepID=UPI0035A5C9E6
MKIKLSAVRMDEQLTASVSGDTITVNGQVLDFSPLQEGDMLPAGAVDSPWLQGAVSRISGDIHLTLVLPHGSNAPHETRFPAAFDTPMTMVDGEVPLPPYDTEPEPMPDADFYNWETSPMPEAFIAGGPES